MSQTGEVGRCHPYIAGSRHSPAPSSAWVGTRNGEALPLLLTPVVGREGLHNHPRRLGPPGAHAAALCVPAGGHLFQAADVCAHTLVSESIDLVVHTADRPSGPQVSEVVAGVEELAGGLEATRTNRASAWVGVSAWLRLPAPLHRGCCHFPAGRLSQAADQDVHLGSRRELRIPLPPLCGPGRFAAVRDCGPDLGLQSRWVQRRTGSSRAVANTVANEPPARFEPPQQHDSRTAGERMQGRGLDWLMTFAFCTNPIDYIRGDERGVAIASLRRYFDGFTGAHFEHLADSGNPDRFTEKDLVAVTMLAVHVPPRTAWSILHGPEADEFSALLADIPKAVDALWIDGDALTDTSSAWKLHHRLIGMDGLGRTTVTKLLAAKRPHLVPIYDSVVAEALCIGWNDDDWSAWRSVVSHESARNEVAAVRDEVPEAADLSLLRTLDIAIWMRHKGWAQTDHDPNPPFRR
jgi:hypothetical protein